MRDYESLLLASAKGVAKLDKYKPNWAKLVDVETLDIRSTEDCVLAQVFVIDGYLDGLYFLGIASNEGPEYGFDGASGGTHEEYFAECDMLTSIWRNLISARQSFGKVMPKHYSTQEIAEVLLQVVDGAGGILIDDMEYVGQGIHKLYLDRDLLLRVSGRES